MTSLFEQYAEGDMSAEEKALFEQRLKTDPGFARGFELYRSMQADMEQWQQTETEREQLKQTLQRITGTAKRPAKVIPLRRRIMWGVAAAAIIALVFWSLMPGNNRKSEQEIYADNVGGEQISFKRGNDADSLWANIADPFNEQQYAAAITPLEKYIASGYDSTRSATAYLGYCYMQVNNDSAAQRIFTQRFPGGKISKRVQWYTALLYVKTKRTDAAKSLLSGLSAAEGEYQQKAAKLLRQLR